MRKALRALGGLAALCFGLLGAGAVPLAGAAPAATPRLRMEVIATNLNNPRGIAIGPDGRLYVAEAGLGAGDQHRGVQEGLGPTSSITEIQRPNSSNPAQRRVVTGLPSAALAGEEGGDAEAIGADGISVVGDGKHARIYTIIGGANAPGTQLGHLMRASLDGSFTSVADVGTVDWTWADQHKNDPFAPPEFPDSNPYGVLATGEHVYVVDAGTNTLDEVLPNGTVKILAYFPKTPVSDAVPTCVARGPDGALYVGTLALADFFVNGPGTATVYRVDPHKVNPNDLQSVLNAPKVWATGFSTITGCTFDAHGNFYAAEMFANDVVRVPFEHPATGRTVLGAGQLTLPNDVAVGSDGSVYVTNNSSTSEAGAGSVVRFRIGGSHDK